MDIHEILDFSGRSVGDIIADLKKIDKQTPVWSDLEKLYNPDKHEIVSDSTLRPTITQNEDGIRDVPAKVTYAAEKNTVRKMVQMAFTIPVKREYNYGDDEGEDINQFSNAIEKVYAANRIDGLNMERMKAYYTTCEMATVWFVQPLDEAHMKYGYPCKFKIRNRCFSPAEKKVTGINQAQFYPHYDEYDDMDAFMMEYSTTSDGTTINHCDIYTADMVYYLSDKDSPMHLDQQLPSPIGKIQAIYIDSNTAIYSDIANNRYEIEFALSRESDLIKKDSNPIIHVSGQLVGEPPKGGATREVIVTEQGGAVNMLAPAFNTTATQSYVEELKKNIEESTQMPNLSLENIKSLSGVVSGEARKTLLTDAHMKVGQEKHSIIRFLEREFSIIKNLVAQTNTKWQKYVDILDCTHTITPFVLNDEASEISNRLKANGGMPLESQRESIIRYGKSEDVDVTLDELKQQRQEAIEEQSKARDLFE